MIDVCFGILMDLLRTRKLTAKYFADKYEISIRSVYRYIDVLSSAGVTIFTERGRTGGIFISDSYRLPATLLTQSEQSIIFNALNFYNGANPTLEVDAIRNKLLAVNSQDSAEKLILSDDKLVLEGIIGDEKQYRAKITPLMRAIDNCQKVQIVYHDRGGEITNRIIEPYSFVLKDMIWYVYAYCELRQSFRMFKISRIEKLLILKESFNRRPQSEFTPWNLSAPQQNSSINLLIYVNENARYFVEEWLGVENVKKQKNKEYPYMASSTIAYDDTVIPKLLSLGANIKVLSPADINSQILAQAKAILEIYK